MKPVLSRAQMRAFDARAIAGAVPGVVLMENAGRGAADIIEREHLRGRAAGAHVVVVAGTGNNGGDGFVVARHLALRGATVEVLVVGTRARVTGDAKTNLDALDGIGVGDSVREIDDANLASLAASIAEADVVVDALFGTGLDRAVGGRHAAAIAAMNATRSPVVALDIPSGLDADTGATHGAAVRAARTVTFACHKLGLLTPGGARACGTIHVADIGVPASMASNVGVSANVVEAEDVAAWVLPRAVDAHKNDAGNVAVIAGSPGKTGAARMVAHAALRAGAGLVTIATWADSAAAVEAGVLEAMTFRIDRANVTDSVDAALAGRRAAVVGPGLGLDDDARLAVERALVFGGTLVVDADALTLFAGKPGAFAAAHAAILTPHPGECARLLATTTSTVEADRFAAARKLASSANAVVLLKGARSIVAAPNGRTVVNVTGNAAMATAGAGDVLSGIVGALACTLDPFEAAAAGAFLHGLAADAWSAKNGDRGLLASEIADFLPRTLAAVLWPSGHARCSV